MRGWLCTPASRPHLQEETPVTYQQGQCLCLGTTRTILFLLADLFCLFLCRDGEEVTFVSERDGNLELYQQQLGKERRSAGAEAAAGDPEASVQHRAAPKRLTYAVSMQVSLLCSGVTFLDLGAAAQLGQCNGHAESFPPSTAWLGWSTVGAIIKLC